MFEQRRTILRLEKDLKKKNPQLIRQAKQIKELQEELNLERETNQESAEAMDSFYRVQFTGSKALDILAEISTDYLAINLENKQLKEENQELKKQQELIKKLTEAKEKDEISEAIKRKQTELSELQKKLNNLQSEEQQIQACQIQQADFSFNLKK